MFYCASNIHREAGLATPHHRLCALPPVHCTLDSMREPWPKLFQQLQGPLTMMNSRGVLGSWLLKGMPPRAHCPEESHTKILPWDSTPIRPRTVVLKLSTLSSPAGFSPRSLGHPPSVLPVSFTLGPSGVGPANSHLHQVPRRCCGCWLGTMLESCCPRQGCSELPLLWDSVICKLKGLICPEPHLNPGLVFSVLEGDSQD